jgi:hypothetical protein
MNSKNISNTNIRNLIAIVLIAVFIPILAVAGEREKHNPYTVLGMQVRSALLPNTPGADNTDLGALVFQEIIPCRFVSTLEKDAYDTPWGGKEFQMMEMRTYWPKGVLVSSKGWENPCTEHVPMDAVAVALRVMSYDAPAEGSVYLAPATYRTTNVPALWFQGGKEEMREATVVLRNGAFSVLVDQQTHMTLDIIGYFQKDPNGYGAQGEKGEKGEKGDKGETGAQGLQGEKGNDGAQGSQGLQGEKGNDGAQGLQGEKGNDGAQGLQGVQGERGEQGLQGLQGERGEKGDKGNDGAQGPQGLNGAKGDKGDNGAQGPQGLNGAKGDKGDNGAQGPQGLNGAKGDKGDNGAQGPMGPQGPAGPKGLKGDKGDPGLGIATMGGPYVFPPGGSLRITDPNVTTDSFILLTYVDVSNGNALGIESISNGSFVATGSPNKPFKYIVFSVH